MTHEFALKRLFACKEHYDEVYLRENKREELIDSAQAMLEYWVDYVNDRYDEWGSYVQKDAMLTVLPRKEYTEEVEEVEEVKEPRVIYVNEYEDYPYTSKEECLKYSDSKTPNKVVKFIEVIE